jgi:formylglycine-generating enzyme required for sulfatase activity
MRTLVALAVTAMMLALPMGAPDRRFRDGMVPVALADGTALSVARHEVTIAEWRACFADGGCARLPAPPSALGVLPVTGVNRFDVEEYLAWANGKSGGGLRLPAIAEWRIIARSLAPEKSAPRFADPRLAWAARYGQDTAPSGPPRPIGSFTTTPDGVSDLDGNVWEWTASCAAPGFDGADAKRCPAYIAAGAHEAAVSVFVRDPATGGCAAGTPPAHLGFRLVSDISQEDRI